MGRRGAATPWRLFHGGASRWKKRFGCIFAESEQIAGRLALRRLLTGSDVLRASLSELTSFFATISRVIQFLPGGRIELPTKGLSVPCSTAELPWPRRLHSASPQR